MSNDFNISDNINNLFTRLEDFIKTKTVVGEPIQIGEVTLVPFIDISFGLGTGGGTGKEQSQNSGGAGSGGKISPTAVLVIRGDKVDLMPINKLANLEKLLEMVPGIVDKLKNNKTEEKV